jgi:hypothetical protein
LAHSSGSGKLSADHRSSGQGSAQSRDQNLEIMIPQLLFSIWERPFGLLARTDYVRITGLRVDSVTSVF